MDNSDAPTPLRAVDTPATRRRTGRDAAEQLSLLSDSSPQVVVSARFRLGKATCERGLRHVAEIKEVLARRQAEREAATKHRLPPRRRPAA